MKKFFAGLFLVTVALFIIAFAIFGAVEQAYNELVVYKNAAISQWAQVENVYQRRVDLIPNLVQATKGIFEQEREVFGAIANARAHYANAPSGTSEKVQAANSLDSALARLMVIVENYPQLRSSETVNNLMFEMAGTENRITVERMRYNESVRVYATATQTFIGRFFSSFFGFKEIPYFKATTAGAETAPQVNLSLKKE